MFETIIHKVHVILHFFHMLVKNLVVLKLPYLSPLCSGVNPPFPQLGQLTSPNPWQPKHLHQYILEG